MNLQRPHTQAGALPRPGATPHGRGLALIIVVAVAFAAGAFAADPPPIEQRVVIVTDSRCGAEGARLDDHRRCALERVSEGDRLVLFDPAREALYEIAFASETLRVMVLNDLTGFRIVARGRWDDEKRIVVLTAASLARTPPPTEVIEAVD